MKQELMEYVEEFNSATKALKEIGADLGKIKIVLKKDAVASYWTRRIREEMNESQNIGPDPDIP